MRRVAIIPVYREVGKIGRVIERFAPDSVDQIYLVLDDPNAAILAEIESSRRQTHVPIRIIENPVRQGKGYELEYYLHYKVLTLGYKFTERPVSKTYSQNQKRGYSHISPLKDWRQIVTPIVLLRIGARH